MRVVTAFAAAFGLASTAFVITMLTKPPVSEARAISTIDTYALTLSSPVSTGEAYASH
ncbi:hypothetical protein [Methylobacterium iners]|uniref:Uncharacterized protein n=1 Tax=Methylobacterium iners TaxID=418707 RepID=A0ABQ4S267_9HYPH|nr:hypothetical protein [Methylobacterium iners]GJD97221.1 hypothetical protein OCOJLMKI_4449 [Methylobacterium iners]